MSHGSFQGLIEIDFGNKGTQFVGKFQIVFLNWQIILKGRKIHFCPSISKMTKESAEISYHILVPVLLF